MPGSQIPPIWIDNFLKDLQRIKIQKGEYYLKKGDKVNTIGYVKKGIFKLVTHNKGRGIIKDFCVETDFLGSYGSILTGEPIQFDIIAMEDSEVVVGYLNKVLESHKDTFEYLKLSKFYLEDVYLKKEDRDFDFMIIGIEEKYIKFTELYGLHINRISKEEIASYLGITFSSFLRFERKFRSIKLK
jgi:CRP-like cAMP-binding protein